MYRSAYAPATNLVVHHGSVLHVISLLAVADNRTIEYEIKNGVPVGQEMFQCTVYHSSSTQKLF